MLSTAEAATKSKLNCRKCLLSYMKKINDRAKASWTGELADYHTLSTAQTDTTQNQDLEGQWAIWRVGVWDPCTQAKPQRAMYPPGHTSRYC